MNLFSEVSWTLGLSNVIRKFDVHNYSYMSPASAELYDFGWFKEFQHCVVWYCAWFLVSWLIIYLCLVPCWVADGYLALISDSFVVFLLLTFLSFVKNGLDVSDLRIESASEPFTTTITSVQLQWSSALAFNECRVPSKFKTSISSSEF